jgi:hypothetical protein
VARRLGGSGFSEGRGSGGSRGRGRGRGRGMQDALIGRRVRVSKGGYRGYVGLVQFASDTHVRIELDATNKVVTIRRDFVDVDKGHGATRSSAASSMRLPPQTPMHMGLGARTPRYTPAYETGACPCSIICMFAPCCSHVSRRVDSSLYIFVLAHLSPLLFLTFSLA